MAGWVVELVIDDPCGQVSAGDNLGDQCSAVSMHVTNPDTVHCSVPCNELRVLSVRLTKLKDLRVDPRKGGETTWMMKRLFVVAMRTSRLRSSGCRMDRNREDDAGQS